MKKGVEIIWSESRGKSFEDLVYLLLNQMFPNTIFKQTSYVHDGGKDFYSVGNIDEEKIWVEAKNYNDHLELSKFSNTFIMADISEINRIIIFSMSELTKGARINIARYAAYHKKTISIYDGKTILYLLKKYRNSIDLGKFINNSIELLKVIGTYELSDLKISVSYEYYYTNQFNLSYRRDKENSIKDAGLLSLPLHSLIAQEVYITNQDLFESRKVSLDFSEYDNNFFGTYFHTPKKDTIIIPPASTHLIVIFFKIINICDNIDLPVIKFDCSEAVIEHFSCQTECCWLGEIPYMGDGWVKLQNTISLMAKDTTKKIITVEGNSGVGKSRFLQELSGYFFQDEYHIILLDFRSMTDLSLKNALQNILSNIYVLDEKSEDKSFFVAEFGELYKDFYNIIFNDSYRCSDNIDKLSTLFSTLFSSKKIFLVIDNMQDISIETSSFFEKLFKDINNSNSIKSYIVLCFNKDYLFQGKAAYNLLNFIRQLNAVYQVELSDFSKGDAKTYLRECLDPRELRSDFDSYYDTIIEEFGTNPFTLKQLMLYLKQRNIIAFVDSMVIITNFSDMKIALSELPTGINQILQFRYQYLFNNIEADTRQSLNQTIWSILFLGKLKANWISKIGLNQKGIQALFNYGFIHYTEKSEIQFCHQLIEKSFCMHFLKTQYVKNPFLTFTDDEDFLNQLFAVTSHIGKFNLCIENMLLGIHFNKYDSNSINRALKALSCSTPRAIMLPLIISSLTDCLNSEVKVDPTLEFKALYAISLACQERFDVHTAAEYTEDLVQYEQETYREKLAAKEEIVLFFKNYVFQLPVAQKYIFLNWLIDEAGHFGLSQVQYNTFMGWLHNRYSKNLCSDHKFDEAETHAQKSLNIALTEKDYCSAAEAEIEYGNIYAYHNASETIKHWNNSVMYIIKANAQSIYFQVFQNGYSLLSQMLSGCIQSDSEDIIEKLLELREKTFLYQKLFIDDICADYYTIQYLDGVYSYKTFKEVVPKLVQMKSESYLHTPQFTILATYKLFTIYRFICNVEPTPSNIDITQSYLLELVHSGIFDVSKITYSMMILYEIFCFCSKDNELLQIVYNELPDSTKEIFLDMKCAKYRKKYQCAITPLTDKKRQVNLLHFNYIF